MSNRNVPLIKRSGATFKKRVKEKKFVPGSPETYAKN